MSMRRGAGPREDPAEDVELAEFAHRGPLPVPSRGAEFRDELRSDLWELLLALLARFRR